MVFHVLSSSPVRNHSLTVFKADAVNVKLFETNTIHIILGQTTNVLLKTKSYYPKASFLMTARPYVTSLGTFDKSTIAGILEYEFLSIKISSFEEASTPQPKTALLERD
ncbi:hypothetical protein K1719_033358 [Acacia pycnantha]|nr:hypothetical protein K1719_033358 [Acacia pycnantha]